MNLIKTFVIRVGIRETESEINQAIGIFAHLQAFIHWFITITVKLNKDLKNRD